MAFLIGGSASVLVWLLAFAVRLMRMAPLQMLGSILTSVCSQVFQIVAFLLPLKVMILLGSPHVPGYFPQAMAGVERERLIFILAISALILYLAHLLMDFIGGLLARVASERLILLPKEGEALSKQQNVALSFYQRMIIICSGVALSAVVLIFLGFFTPELLAVVFGYFATIFLVGALVFAWKPALSDIASAQLSRLIDVLAATGFLLVFGFLVIDYLYGDAHSLLLGVLVLLLCRQLFSRLARALKCIEGLYRYRERTHTLLGGSPLSMFDSGNVFDDFWESEEGRSGLLEGETNEIVRRRSEQRALPFWRLTAPEQCAGWVRDILVETGVAAVKTDITPMEVGRRGELSLRLACHRVDQATNYFLFKAFSRQEAQLVAHAESLLALYPGDAAPRLLKTYERNGVVAHLYEWAQQVRLVEDVQSVLACREQVFIESSAWSVPQELHSSVQPRNLADRCSPALWTRCQAFSRWLDVETQQLVDSFAAAPMRLQQALRGLPQRVYNPDIVAGNIFELGRTLQAVRWERWSLEPIGSGWPIELGLERLDEAFECAREGCEELQQLLPLQVRLAALTFAFEEYCAQCAYLSAFALLKTIRDVLDALERLPGRIAHTTE